MDYSRKKVLIRTKATYSSNYCDMHDRGIYEGRNLNTPILNKFTRNEISFLNFHNCLKHGKSRIVCQYDMIARKIRHSKETSIILNPKEKLGQLMKVENENKYLFLKYEANNMMKLFNYDFDTDCRQEMGHIKSKYDLTKVRNTKILPQMLYTSTMPLKLK